MASGSSARWMAQALVLELLIAAVIAGTVGADGGVAPPRVVANAPPLHVSPYNKCTQLRPIISGDDLKFQWEEPRRGQDPQVWEPVAGETNQWLNLKYTCTPLGYNPIFRLVAFNSAGRVYTRPTVVSPQLTSPRFLAHPPALVIGVDGAVAPMELEWVLARDVSADTVTLSVVVEPGPNAPDKTPYERLESTSKMRGPLRLVVRIPQRHEWNGTILKPSVTFECNSPEKGSWGGDASGIWAPYVSLQIIPVNATLPRKVSSCPADAVDADYDGWVIRSGDASPRLPSCADCRALCAATVGCDVWVYGAARDSHRSGQCWLKASQNQWRRWPVKKDAAPTSPWMSGKLPDYTRCQGEWGADLDGEILVPGDANHKPDCIACADACAVLPGCDVWVWGYLPSSSQYRECWLKRAAQAGKQVLKPGSGNGSPWLSGEILTFE